ncbi:MULTISPECIES: ATP-binding cassette domain-containing protein [unclassified Lactobacillus]|uniref:ABC transporter ATP-binding protein n=1 Tax=unclassified Lactobacillus TaxID=2620435 RepID=UPI00226AA1FF|nr:MULTISPECIES: ATP-binding cassette domain-containing protein [unclassified Lactobacillus]MCX8721658.1 ATP-binding cassette domain-containing protein [Lactobacillus sp. B4010]MCX8731339.1 ATP-binding cassette domain-containing protein [Lactobacillus sp. B4015]MCX8733560.1 ATP-binding cassette domain-containing protein [Lactobacillus sp. B4012]
MSYLELTNVTKKINDETVLNDINLKIDQGKIIGFVGTNGSGKTMLFRAILGLIKISSGQVILKGQEVGLNTERQVNVGAIIETPGFIKSYTALKNLQYLASIKNIVGKDEIIAAMKVFDLEKVKDKKVKKFSLGMRQKLAIVQAFMERQELLVLDEPTNGLDKESVQIFENLMKQLRARGVTVLLASHDDRVIKSVADEYYQIDGGKIVSD